MVLYLLLCNRYDLIFCAIYTPYLVFMKKVRITTFAMFITKASMEFLYECLILYIDMKVVLAYEI